MGSSFRTTDSPVIETLQRPLDGDVRVTGSSGRLNKPSGREAFGEAQERRAREHVSVTGEERALERARGRGRPGRIERSGRVVKVRGNPKSAVGMKQGPQGFG
jgi:hypothetical protein